MVGVTKIGRRNANYWINAVAEGADDYYTKPGEAPGKWLGALAAELGLEGEVDAEEYAALLAGQHPKTGEPLVARAEPRTYIDANGNERRAEPILGYDIRFSAPKSVSLLWALGSPEVRETILRAQEYAVSQGLAYVERHACFVRRGKGGVDLERGSGFISMAFLHRSSRAGDPALHTHVVTANMTRAASDGRWLTLANPKGASPLFREAKPAGYVYQAALRAFLTRELGVGWEEVINGYADIAGIERAVIDHLSQRRGEIVAEMAERGTSSAKAAEVAAYRTREAKDYGVDVDAQREDWRARAGEFGFDEAAIDALLRGGRCREPASLGADARAAALAELEAHHSHFDRRDLLCALANQMRDGVDLTQLEAAVEGLIAGDQLREIHRGEGLLGTTYYTTPRLWEMEQRVLEVARQGQEASAGVVSERTLTAVLDRHRYLSNEQAAMVRRLTTGRELIVTVAALPGTGKTTALNVAREAWALEGHRGIGVATARSASLELEDAGIPSTSVTDLLIRCEKMVADGKPPLPPGTIIVLDEPSTTPTPDMAALVGLIEGCGGKLVANGDPRQIGAVGPGGLYGALTREHEPCCLTEIRRQRDPLDREIVRLAHEGRGSDALDLLRTDERLVIADTLPEALDALVLDWHERFKTGEDAVMIARRGRDVDALNERARVLLKADGSLGERCVEVGGREFAVGDCLITRVNGPDVSNRERWRVVGIDEDEGHLKLERIGGEERTVILTPAYLARETESGEPAVEHANALTTYATQSQTFPSAFTLLDGGIAREDFLVAVSRARGQTTAYGVAATELLDPDLGPAMREVNDPAHDLRVGAERVATEYAASEVAARKRIEALSETELVDRRRQLMQQMKPAQEPATSAQKLAGLDRRIEEAETRLHVLAAERNAGALSRPDEPADLARIESIERLTRQQLSQLQEDRANARPSNAAGDPPRAFSPSERAELAMVTERLDQLRRREVGAERLRPSNSTLNALGPRPTTPEEVRLWNEGVELLLAYRQRNGLAAGSEGLGHRPTDSNQRREYDRAQAELRQVQRNLPSRAEVLDPTPSIGR